MSVRVNEVIGVAGYVLPGTHVDVVATVSPTGSNGDMTSKVVLTDVQVLAAGTKIERDTDRNKPIAVSVVTLLVNPEEAERLTLASTEGKIQLALRNPLDKSMPVTQGIRPAGLARLRRATRTGVHVKRTVAAGPSVSVVPPRTSPSGYRRNYSRDKRAHEIVRQERKPCVSATGFSRLFPLPLAVAAPGGVLFADRTCRRCGARRPFGGHRHRHRDPRASR